MLVLLCIGIWIGGVMLAEELVPAQTTDRETVVVATGLIGGLVVNVLLVSICKGIVAFKRAYFTIRLCDSWIGRRMVGVLYYCGAILFAFAVTGLLIYRPGEPLGQVMPLWIGSALLILLTSHRVLGVVLAPVQKLWRCLRMGLGGSARFAGMLQEWRTLYKRGSIYLGPSLYWKRWHVGHDDDRSVVTIASIGAGKGRCSIINNLLLWPGWLSLLMIDPKGTNAAVTARARHRLAHIHESWRLRLLNFFIAAPLRFVLSFWPRAVDWDPFFDRLPARAGIIDPHYEVMGPAARFRTRINLVAGLDPEAPDIAEEIADFASALVVPSSEREPVWDEGGEHILSGCLATVLSIHGKGKFTLMDVRDLVLKDQDALLEIMLAEAEKGGPLSRLILGGAAPLMTGHKESAAYLQVARRNSKWLDSEAMAGVLIDDPSDEEGVGLKRLKLEGYSLYVVLPPHMLEIHSRFLRLFTTAAVREMTRPPRSRRTVLFCLEDAYALKKLGVLTTAASVGRSYKLKLWSIYQNIGQLAELYGEANYEVFLSAAGCLQLFGLNDKRTEEYIKDRIGHHIVDGIIRLLRLPDELRRQTGREGGTQIVLRSGQDPLLLGLSNYDRMFFRGSYDYDPDFVSPKYYGAAKKPQLAEADEEKDWDWKELLDGENREAQAPRRKAHGQDRLKQPGGSMLQRLFHFLHVLTGR
jgi:hypothetical protein